MRRANLGARRLGAGAILNLMRDLQDKLAFLTYMFISHNPTGVRHRRRAASARMDLGRIVEIAEGRELFARPRMPYTKMRLGAVPDLTMSRPQAYSGQGEIPNPINPPARLRLQSALPAGVRSLPQGSPGTDAGVACHAR